LYPQAHRFLDDADERSPLKLAVEEAIVFPQKAQCFQPEPFRGPGWGVGNLPDQSMQAWRIVWPWAVIDIVTFREVLVLKTPHLAAQAQQLAVRVAIEVHQRDGARRDAQRAINMVGRGFFILVRAWLGRAGSTTSLLGRFYREPPGADPVRL